VDERDGAEGGWRRAPRGWVVSAHVGPPV